MRGMGSGTVPRPRTRAADGRPDRTGGIVADHGDPDRTGGIVADYGYRSGPGDRGGPADDRYREAPYGEDPYGNTPYGEGPYGNTPYGDAGHPAEGYPADPYPTGRYPEDDGHVFDDRYPDDGHRRDATHSGAGDRYDTRYDTRDGYADQRDRYADQRDYDGFWEEHEDDPPGQDVFPRTGGIRTGGPSSGAIRTGGIRTGMRPAPVQDAARLATPKWWGTAAAGLGWSSLSVVVAFWAANAQATWLTSAAELYNAAGRLTGLLSADLLMLQVLTMARVPWLERTYGQDGLARVHRRMGFWSFNLLLAHIALITIGYALSAETGVVAQFVDLVTEADGVLLATASTGFLTLVVVTSIRAARRRTRYETWHLLHLYAYLGIGLSIPHELAIGGDLTASPLATVYWWTIYLMALAALLIWRVWLPLYRTLRYGLRVERVVPEGPGVVSVHIRGRNLSRLNAGAGQFFLWRFLGRRGWTRAHPYSLSAAPTEDLLRITVKELGDDSSRMINLRPGTRVIAEGPFGRLHSGVRTCRKVTLFAAGIGITPMRALLEELDYAPGDVTLIYRATDERELVLAEEIDLLAEQKGARVHYLIGPRRRSRRHGSWLPQSAGSLTDVEGLRWLVPDIAGHDIYLCGPDPWLDSVVRALRRARVRPDRIHLERFSW